MAAQRPDGYEFETLPLSSIPPGTNLLLTGPICDTTRDLFLRLLLGDDGVVVIGPARRETQSAFEGVGGSIDPNRVRLISCAHEDIEDGQGVPADDLSGIGLKYANDYEAVYERGFEHVRTGIYTLTTLLAENEDVRPVFRFINTVASRVRTADGFGIYWIDPDAHDDRVLPSIAPSFDGRIEVRTVDDDPELRARGLEDQPHEWTGI